MHVTMLCTFHPDEKIISYFVHVSEDNVFLFAGQFSVITCTSTKP